MTDNYSLIRQAIIDKKQVIAIYHDHLREVCPHAIGAKGGREQAICFQFGGTSSRGLPPEGEWRCLVIAELSDLEVVEGPWHTADNHSIPNTCIDEVDVEVAH